MSDRLTSPSPSSTRSTSNKTMIETQPQPDAAAPAPTVPEGAIERVLRRSILALTRDNTTTQDRLDLAELAEALGADALAAIARDIAMLRRGFGAEGPLIATPTGSIERAVGELRDLMGDAAGAAPPAAAETMDAPAACSALCRLLSAPLDEGGEAELGALLVGWRSLADAKATDLRERSDAPLPDLAKALAASELSAFLQRNRALAFPPYGSARLLHRTARLPSGGLGPYLSSVGNIVRSGRDVLGLITLAGGEDGAADRIEVWTVPLTAYLPEHLVEDLADELADLGLIGAIFALLNATLQRTDRQGLVRRLRDAAMDLGDDALALSAQHHVVNLTRFDAVEWRCLGAMLATSGSNEAAEAAFLYADKIAPGDPTTLAHLAALRSGDFEEFAVRGGFGTPEYRKRLRFARRKA